MLGWMMLMKSERLSSEGVTSASPSSLARVCTLLSDVSIISSPIRFSGAAGVSKGGGEGAEGVGVAREGTAGLVWSRNDEMSACEAEVGMGMA